MNNKLYIYIYTQTLNPICKNFTADPFMYIYINHLISFMERFVMDRIND